MLQERLEGADRSARKKRLTAAVVVVVGLSGFGLWLAEMWVNDRPPAVNPKPAGSGPAPEARKPNAESEPAPAVTDHTAVPVDTESRERFKEIFGRYLADVEPVILSEAFARWDAGAQREIADMKAAALQAFGEGSHAEALARIEALLAQAREALRLREAAFARALSGARAGLERDDYDGAGLHIAEALRIKPESPEALRLNTRIEGLQKVLVHLEAARVARLENDPQAELRSLENVVRLDPARQAVRGRLGTLVKELRDSRYSRHIARGLAALENKDLGKARRHLVQARQLFPDRAETALLARQVLDLDKVIKVEGLVRRARAAAQADDWSAALDAYRELEGIEPGNEEAVRGGRTAVRILSLRSAIQAFLDAPHRLSSPNVAARAREVAAQSMETRGGSPELAARTADLQQKLERYSREIPIQVVSDGKTRISVRGVGRVGTVVSKVIRLKPGAYSFEGRRSGYRSKIVKVRVQPDASDVRVEIVCDEPI